MMTCDNAAWIIKDEETRRALPVGMLAGLPDAAPAFVPPMKGKLVQQLVPVDLTCSEHSGF